MTCGSLDRRVSTTVTDYVSGVAQTPHVESHVFDEGAKARGNVLLDFVDTDGPSGNAPAVAKRYLWNDAVDQIFAQEDLTQGTSAAERFVWLIQDRLGTIRDVLDRTGAVVARVEYDSFGRITSIKDGSGQTLSIPPTRFGFTAQEYDAHTGLVWYSDGSGRGRWYSPTLQRFINRDEPLLRDGTNDYRYVGNSPTNFTDPSGQTAERFVGNLWYTEKQLREMGYTDHSINYWKEHGYRFGTTRWQDAIGLKEGKYTKEPYTFRTGCGAEVQGYRIVDLESGKIWYAVPEDAKTWKNGRAPAVGLIQKYKEWREGPAEFTGAKRAGYSFYRSYSDAVYNLSGDDRMAAIGMIAGVYGLGGGGVQASRAVNQPFRTARPPGFRRACAPKTTPVETPSAKPRGSANPAVKQAAARGSSLHADRPGNLPDQLRQRYPETKFEFTKPGVKGQDVRVTGGKHPSEYSGSTWPKGVNHGDFKPATAGGERTFSSDQRLKWPEPTQFIPYDPATGTLK